MRSSLKKTKQNYFFFLKEETWDWKDSSVVEGVLSWVYSPAPHSFFLFSFYHFYIYLHVYILFMPPSLSLSSPPKKIFELKKKRVW
jgi:hypothetical protein